MSQPRRATPHTSRLTICTVWLNSSRSAVMEEIWSISRCFLEKKRSRRVLRVRQDVTLDLYRSLSLRTTAEEQRFQFELQFELRAAADLV